ncbi:CAP domain-containing protein [Massilicoli timonensis]|uniref:CAP domain-containing protein n=1 Tax=Massilicoli timonensis TaxID=2015901 RepID=UPI000C81DFEB|nr:CAP domain-containing protein [Massilicoli timonensis]
MWKTLWKEHKKTITGIMVISVGFACLLMYVLFSHQETDDIRVVFNSDIQVEEGTVLTEKMLIKETNADKIDIPEDKAENVGTQTVKIIAMLKDEQKEFSTRITVLEKKTEEPQEQQESEEKPSKQEDEADNDQITDNSRTQEKITEATESKASSQSSQNTAKNENTQSSSQNSNDSQTQKEESSSDSQQEQTPSQSQISETEFANQLFALVNNYRTANGLSALGTNAVIQSLANQRAQDMADMGYASHTRPDGSVVNSYWVETNYGIIAGGENVFAGTQGWSPQAVLDSFLASSGHRRTIMDENSYMAIGVRYADGLVFVSMNFQQ